MSFYSCVHGGDGVFNLMQIWRPWREPVNESVHSHDPLIQWQRTWIQMISCPKRNAQNLVSRARGMLSLGDLIQKVLTIVSWWLKLRSCILKKLTGYGATLCSTTSNQPISQLIWWDVYTVVAFTFIEWVGMRVAVSLVVRPRTSKLTMRRSTVSNLLNLLPRTKGSPVGTSMA